MHEEKIKNKDNKILNMIDQKVEMEDEIDRQAILIEQLSKSEYTLLKQIDTWRKKFIEMGINPEIL